MTHSSMGCGALPALLAMWMLLPAVTSMSVYNPHSYVSTILQGRITIELSPSQISIKVPMPPSLNSLFLWKQPAMETFNLPTGMNGSALNMSLVDHVSIYYNPLGTQPYPNGTFDPTPVNDEQRKNAWCLSCYVFFSFHLATREQASQALGSCATNDHGFCDPEANGMGSGVFQAPAREYLPPTFSASSGTLYDHVPLTTPYDDAVGNFTTCTPIGIPQLGQVWVSTLFPTYVTPSVVKATNYFLTAAGQVLGVGQAIPTTYFQILSNKDTHLLDRDNPGFFDTPTNFTQSGAFPAAAISAVAGTGGDAVFEFGYTFKHVQQDVWMAGSDSANAGEIPNAAARGAHLSLLLALVAVAAAVWVHLQ